MLIASILLSLIFIGQVVVMIMVFSLVRRIKSTENSQKNRFQKAMDMIVQKKTQEPVTPIPNEATKKVEDNQILDENVPWDIPQDVKITVEGGDTLAPPDYEVN